MAPYSKLTILLLIVASCLVSCRSKNEQPWTLDPIYADLVATSAGLASKSEAQQKKIEDLKMNLEKMAPRDPARKRTTKEMYDLERGLVQMEQQAKYFEIRAEQRKEYAKKAYDQAFDEGKDWPDPQELADYKEFQKVKHAPRNWEDRVPKMTRYNHQEAVPAKEEKKEGGGEGHGGGHGE